MTDIQPTDTLAPQPWMLSAPVSAIITALEANGAPARFVGGCVRDAILGRQVRDIDVATPETPEAAMRLLKDAGIRVIPTGIKHGTVTAVADGQPVEVTTLRVDAETDGRWANVEFTEDWQADAARRDFTMNALYCGIDGAIFDPVGGLKDLKAGRVRFIGDPAARLVEDYLRLLRFFRFYAWYGKGPADSAALAACAAAAPNLSSLSGERVWAELSRLLCAPDPVPTVSLMADQEILPHLLPVENPGGISAAQLAAMVAAESSQDTSPDAIRRLASWLAGAVGDGEKASEYFVRVVSSRLVHSNRERAGLRNLLMPAFQPGTDVPMAENRRILYRLADAERFFDLVLFRQAEDGGDPASWRAISDIRVLNPPPEFPIGGDDVMEIGVEGGPRVGELLAELEGWWVDHDFEPDRAALLARLNELART